MTDQPPAAATPTPPLHLPVGSVRAIVTLAVLGTVWIQLLRGLPTSEVLHDTLLLVLGYYFGARHARAAVATATGPRHEPLFLPRGSVRLLILLGFAAVGWKLHQAGRLDQKWPPALVLVGTFLVGGVFKALVSAVSRFVVRPIEIFGHALAAVTILVVVSYCIAVMFAHEQLVPAVESVFLGVVGFYMGER